MSSDIQSGSPQLPADFSLLQPSGESVLHLLLGSPSAIHQTRHLLHNLRYVEVSRWSPLIELINNKLSLRADQGEQMSLLNRRL